LTLKGIQGHKGKKKKKKKKICLGHNNSTAPLTATILLFRNHLADKHWHPTVSPSQQPLLCTVSTGPRAALGSCMPAGGCRAATQSSGKAGARLDAV